MGSLGNRKQIGKRYRLMLEAERRQPEAMRLIYKKFGVKENGIPTIEQAARICSHLKNLMIVGDRSFWWRYEAWP